MAVRRIFPYLPLIFFLVLFALVFLLNKADLEDQFPKVVPKFFPAAYPIKVGKVKAPVISAKAAVVLDASSKKVMYEKNSHLRFSPASTVKIMTALVTLEKFPLDAIFTIKEEVSLPSTMYLREGEEISVENLLYGLLLTSGNDAAVALAQNYEGGESAFVKRMNQKAQELRLLDTNFNDPAGFDDDGNFTNALDLAHLSAEAIKNETLARMFATKEKIVFDKTGQISHQLQNLNKLLGTNGVNGVKTGTTIGAGEVLITSATRDGHVIITVVMKSEDRFADSTKLIGWTWENFQFVDLSKNLQ